MRINCPACKIAYEVPEAKLRGRKLRCAGCGHGWMPLPAPAPVLAPVVAPVARPIAVPGAVPGAVFEADSPAHEPLRPRVAPLAAPRRGEVAVLLGWIVTILICAGGAWAVLHDRSWIMHAWPPAIRFYRLLGLSSGN